MNSNDGRRVSHRGSASVRRAGSHTHTDVNSNSKRAEANKQQRKPADRQERTVKPAERQINKAERPANRPERPAGRAERPVRNQERPVSRTERPANNQERPVNRTDKYRQEHTDRTPVSISNASRAETSYRGAYNSQGESAYKSNASSDRRSSSAGSQYNGRRTDDRKPDGRKADVKTVKKNEKPNKSNNIIFAGIAIVLALILCIFMAFRFVNKDKTEEETTAANPNALIQDAVIDLSLIVEPAETAAAAEGEEAPKAEADPSKLYIKGMTLDEIKDTIYKNYDWSLKILNEDARVGEVVKPTVDANETTEAATMGDAEKPDQLLEPAAAMEQSDNSLTVSNEILIPDLVALGIDELVNSISEAENALRREMAATEAETEKAKKKNKKATAEEETVSLTEYKLELPQYDAFIDEAVSKAELMWYKAPKGGGIGSYDKENDSFVMEGAENGFEVDKAALRAELEASINDGNYTNAIKVPGKVLKTDMQAVRAEYKTLSSFSTKTTNNKIRNNNIKIACEKLNGTIVKPGEEFSFNDVVGERTAAKGYGAAAAYNNGEVVQEIGGGVCQVSTTLYNAVLRAGLKTTKRQSHTFKPSYVTPGWDATISWGGPDYKFANVPSRAEFSNDKSYAIGIRAHYADNEVTVSIYGRPVLKDGYSYELESKKIKDIDIVRKLIEEGSDKQPTQGSMGSQWSTDVVIRKNGEEVKREYDHKTYYSGHIQYYLEEEPSESSSEQGQDASMDPSQSVDPTGPDGGPGVGMTETQKPDSTRPSDQLDNNGPGEGGASGQDKPGNIVETFGKETSPGYIDIF